jgi:hypothetical protein
VWIGFLDTIKDNNGTTGTQNRKMPSLELFNKVRMMGNGPIPSNISMLVCIENG